MFDVGQHFSSMKITQDVREYAAQKEIDEQAALGVGMKEKAEEFVTAGRRFTGDLDWNKLYVT